MSFNGVRGTEFCFRKSTLKETAVKGPVSTFGRYVYLECAVTFTSTIQKSFSHRNGRSKTSVLVLLSLTLVRKEFLLTFSYLLYKLFWWQSSSTLLLFFSDTWLYLRLFTSLPFPICLGPVRVERYPVFIFTYIPGLTIMFVYWLRSTYVLIFLTTPRLRDWFSLSDDSFMTVE